MELIMDIVNEKLKTASGIRAIQDSISKGGGTPNEGMYAIAKELEEDANRIEAAYRREKNLSNESRYVAEKVSELGSLFESVRSSMENLDCWLQSVGSSLSLCQTLIGRCRKVLGDFSSTEISTEKENEDDGSRVVGEC